MIWKNLYPRLKSSLSVFLGVLFLSFLGTLLFPLSSVSAYTLSSAVKDHITGVDLQVPGLRVNTVVNSQNGSGIQFDVTRTVNPSWTNDTIYLAVLLETTIPANSIVSVSMSVSHANTSDAPVCFTGDWGTQVIDCDVNGDNTNNTISAIFYTTRALDRLILYSYNSAPNITLGTPAFAIGSVVYSSVQSESGALSGADIAEIKQRLIYLVNNTNVVDNGMRSRLDDIISAINGLDIEGLNDKLDEQLDLEREKQEKEEQQEQDLQDSQDSTQESADDATAEAQDTGANLFSAFTTLVASLHSVSATNCKLPNFSIYGLAFNNMDLCLFSVPSGLLALGSIGMVFIIVPMGIALVKQLLGLYNELFGGKG